MVIKRSSGLSFDAGPLDEFEQIIFPPTAGSTKRATFLQRNKTERKRLQGLVQPLPSEPTDTKNNEKERLGLLEKAKVWMVNEGKSFSPSLV